MINEKKNFFARVFTALLAKRFNRKEKAVLILAAHVLLVAGHFTMQHAVTSVTQKQIVVPLLAPSLDTKGELPPPVQREQPAEAPPPVARVIRDPFLPSRDAERTAKLPEPPKPTVALIVNGILWDETTPTAIVNSRVVGIGDMIFGKTVVDIERDRVVIMESGVMKMLYLKK